MGFRYSRRVQFADTDLVGIVHFSMFFRYMEEAEHALWRAAGLPVVQGADDAGWPRVSATFDYKAPLRFEDEFDVEVELAATTRAHHPLRVHPPSSEHVDRQRNLDRGVRPQAQRRARSDPGARRCRRTPAERDTGALEALSGETSPNGASARTPRIDPPRRSPRPHRMAAVQRSRAASIEPKLYEAGHPFDASPGVKPSSV